MPSSTENDEMIAPVENERPPHDVALRRIRVEPAEPVSGTMSGMVLGRIRSVVARHPAMAMIAAVAVGLGAGWAIKRRGQ